MPAPPPVRRRPPAGRPATRSAPPRQIAPPPSDARLPRFRMSRVEYEAFTEEQETKFEWVDGEAIEMSGATEEHCDLTGNLDFLLRTVIRRRGGGAARGKVYNGDMRVRTRGGAGPNRYPDVSVVVGESRFARHPEDKKLDLLNPTVLIEVLSDSTAEDDEHGRKFEDYTATPSVSDYVLADSRAMRVVHRTRRAAGESWAEAELTDPADVLELPAVGFAATLAEIYEGVSFDSATE